MHKQIKCLIVDDEPVARDILSKHLSKIQSVEIVALCKNALEAFNIINSRKIDLIFLDINMPEISGLSFARSINNNIKIIFTTAYREYALEGFDLQAVDYLLKPISFERLLQSVNKYMDQKPVPSDLSSGEIKSEKIDYFFVRSERKMVKICFEEIRYIESISDYIRIHLKERSVVTRATISSIEAKLPQNEFLRTHRSFIVYIPAIDSFTNEYLELGADQIPISRSYKSGVLLKLEKE